MRGGNLTALKKPLMLHFDCAACHLHSTVRSLAKTLGLQVLVVPAGPALQPLDAHIFRTLLCEIRRADKERSC